MLKKKTVENLLMAFLASNLHVTCYIGYQSQKQASVQRIERMLDIFNSPEKLVVTLIALYIDTQLISAE